MCTTPIVDHQPTCNPVTTPRCERHGKTADASPPNSCYSMSTFMSPAWSPGVISDRTKGTCQERDLIGPVQGRPRPIGGDRKSCLCIPRLQRPVCTPDRTPDSTCPLRSAPRTRHQIPLAVCEVHPVTPVVSSQQME